MFAGREFSMPTTSGTVIRILGMIVLLGSFLIASGCGDSEGPTGRVTGTLQTGSQPTPSGVVTLYDSQLVPAGTATLGADGQFEFEAPIPFGTYTATLMPVSDVPAGDEDPQLAQANAMIPQRFRDPSASPLQVVIDEDEEKVELKME